MHAYFSIFYIFLFLFFIYIFYFFRAGLGPASPARSLAQASDPAGPSQQEARVDWLHTCIMHSAKVINLPSHRATLHSKRMYKNESKMAYLFSGDGGDGGSALPFVCSQPSLLLSFASVPAVPFLFLFFPAFSVLVMKHWGRCWLLLSKLGLGFVLCLCWCSFISHSLYPLSLVFSARPALFFFSVFFLLFSVSFFSPSPLVLFLSSPRFCDPPFFLLSFLFLICRGRSRRWWCQSLVFWVSVFLLLGVFRSFFFLLPRGRLCPAFIKPAAASVVVTVGLLNAL